MPDEPKKDKYADWPDEMSFPGDGVVKMHPNGPTDFGIGKNINKLDSTNCDVDFEEAQDRGYAFFKDDVRDIELKCLVRFDGDFGDHGFSISACTGRHSGGGCCSGFAYMSTLEMTENPSSFRFRKEMWHVDYNTSPEGTMHHDKMDFKIVNCGHYIGIGLCRYNDPKDEKKAVFLEYWFNPNPEEDIKDWTMLRRIRDHPGFGWGKSGGKCNGAKDQVGTWSNIQNRFKTNADSGTCTFKAVSMREIDPTGDLSEPDPIPGGDGGGPAPPGGGGNPTENPPVITTVQSTFTLMRDINVYTSITCAGDEEGGGAGGTTKVYGVASDNANVRELSNTETNSFRTRIAQRIAKAASPINNQIIKQVDVYLKKSGSPTTPDIELKIWNDNGVVAYTSGTTIDPSTLTTSFVKYSFDCSDNTYRCGVGDRIGVEWDSASSSNIVLCSFSTAGDGIGIIGSYESQYEDGSWINFTDRDMSEDIYQGA